MNSSLPKKGHILIPRTCGCITLRGKRDFADGITLGILRLPWMDDVGGPKVLTRVFGRGGRRVRVREGGVSDTGAMWDHEQGTRAASGTLGKAKT